jgi:hypothetical protein
MTAATVFGLVVLGYIYLLHHAISVRETPSDS